MMWVSNELAVVQRLVNFEGTRPSIHVPTGVPQVPLVARVDGNHKSVAMKRC